MRRLANSNGDAVGRGKVQKMTKHPEIAMSALQITYDKLRLAVAPDQLIASDIAKHLKGLSELEKATPDAELDWTTLDIKTYHSDEWLTIMMNVSSGKETGHG